MYRFIVALIDADNSTDLLYGPFDSKAEATAWIARDFDGTLRDHRNEGGDIAVWTVNRPQ